MPGRHVPKPPFMRKYKEYSKENATLACKPYDFKMFYEQIDTADLKITCHCDTNDLKQLALHLNPISITKKGEGKFEAVFSVHSFILRARSPVFNNSTAKVMKSDGVLDLNLWPVHVVSEFVQFLYGFYDHLEGCYDIIPLIDQWEITKDVTYALCPIISYNHKNVREAISSVLAMMDHPFALMHFRQLFDDWLINCAVVSGKVGVETDNAALCKLPFDIFHSFITSKYIYTLHTSFVKLLINFYEQFNDITDAQHSQLKKVSGKHYRVDNVERLCMRIKRVATYQYSGKFPATRPVHREAHGWIQDFFKSEEEMHDAYKRFAIVRYLCFNNDEGYYKSFKWDAKPDMGKHVAYFVFKCYYSFDEHNVPVQFNDYTDSNKDYDTYNLGGDDPEPEEPTVESDDEAAVLDSDIDSDDEPAPLAVAPAAPAKRPAKPTAVPVRAVVNRPPIARFHATAPKRPARQPQQDDSDDE